MKRNAFIRIAVYSLLIVVLLSILFRGIAAKNLKRHTSPANTITVSDTSEQDGVLYKAENIQAIQVNWAAGNIRIGHGTQGYGIQVLESGNTAGNSMLVKQFSDRFEIDFSDEKGWKLRSQGKKDLTILLPEDWKLAELEINTAASDLTLEEMEIDSVTINLASGECLFQECALKSLNVNGASAKVSFTGTVDSVDLDGASLHADVTVRNAPMAIKLDGMSADLKLTLPDSCGFQLKRDSLSGKTSCDFETRTDDGCLIYGDGSCKIDIDGLSASVAILKG